MRGRFLEAITETSLTINFINPDRFANVNVDSQKESVGITAKKNVNFSEWVAVKLFSRPPLLTMLLSRGSLCFAHTVMQFGN